MVLVKCSVLHINVHWWNAVRFSVHARKNFRRGYCTVPEGTGENNLQYHQTFFWTSDLHSLHCSSRSDANRKMCNSTPSFAACQLCSKQSLPLLLNRNLSSCNRGRWTTAFLKKEELQVLLFHIAFGLCPPLGTVQVNISPTIRGVQLFVSTNEIKKVLCSR